MMAPYRRREVTLLAACLIVLFCLVRFSSFGGEHVTDDEAAAPPLFRPEKNFREGSIFHKSAAALWRSNGQPGNGVPSVPPKNKKEGGKDEQRKPVRESDVKARPEVSTDGEKEKDYDEEFGRVQGPSNKANSTLGFGAIVAISTLTSKRREPLKLSGELTGLKISIPDQPKWTDDDINGFKAANMSVIMRGSVLAWLGHLNALKWFVEQPFDTAMFMEDDVDWDIHLRSHQIPLVQRAFSEHIAARNPTAAPGEYWPSSEHWEMLYLGHCGDFFKASELAGTEHVVYPDASMPTHRGLHTDTQRFMTTLSRTAKIPYPKHRVLHRSKRPLCTFAYAINKATARRMLKDMAREEEDHGTIAYDVRILEACRDWGWKCWTLNPELFHHVDGEASEIRTVDGGETSDSKQIKVNNWPPNKPKPKPTDEEIARGRARGTPNISCGIRALVERMGAGEIVRKIVRLAMEVDGLCPMTVAEIDGMREWLDMKGRDDIPVGD